MRKNYRKMFIVSFSFMIFFMTLFGIFYAKSCVLEYELSSAENSTAAMYRDKFTVSLASLCKALGKGNYDDVRYFSKETENALAHVDVDREVSEKLYVLLSSPEEYKDILLGFSDKTSGILSHDMIQKLNTNLGALTLSADGKKGFNCLRELAVRDDADIKETARKMICKNISYEKASCAMVPPCQIYYCKNAFAVVSVAGGFPIYMIYDNPKSGDIKREECLENARKFIRDHIPSKYTVSSSVELIDEAENERSYVFKFAPSDSKEKVIEVSVSRYSGRVTCFDSFEYFK